jgi:hypothetical protein
LSESLGSTNSNMKEGKEIASMFDIVAGESNNNPWYTLSPVLEKEIRKQNGGIPVDGVLVKLYAFGYKFVRPWLFPKKGIEFFF